MSFTILKQNPIKKKPVRKAVGAAPKKKPIRKRVAKNPLAKQPKHSFVVECLTETTKRIRNFRYWDGEKWIANMLRGKKFPTRPKARAVAQFLIANKQTPPNCVLLRALPAV